jgi:ferredoxin, 2Fe-2S
MTATAGRLTIQPSGHVVEIRADETLIQAAWRAGLHWPTLCYGIGRCTACQCEIVSGLDHLSALTEAERAALRDLGRRRRRVDPRRVRLACQAHADGDVVVRKPGVRDAPPEQDR